jgi:hypothetical protein
MQTYRSAIFVISQSVLNKTVLHCTMRWGIAPPHVLKHFWHFVMTPWWIAGSPDLDAVALLFLQDMPVLKFETEESFFVNLSNLTDPILDGDPSIQHWVGTNWLKRYYGFLPWAHFRDEKVAVARFFLQEGSIGYNEPNCKNNRATLLCWLSYMRRMQVPSSIYDFCCSFRLVGR